MSALDELEQYYTVKKQFSGHLTFPEVENCSSVLGHESKQYLLWIFARLVIPMQQIMPSWIGFLIILRENVPVLESTVRYFETINAPTTEMSTVYGIWKRFCRIKDKLNLPSVVCVFDEAVYAKACEIVWKKREIFKDVVLMLGNFHLLMMCLGV